MEAAADRSFEVGNLEHPLVGIEVRQAREAGIDPQFGDCLPLELFNHGLDRVVAFKGIVERNVDVDAVRRSRRGPGGR